jgi:hypothetical protein
MARARSVRPLVVMAANSCDAEGHEVLQVEMAKLTWE